MKARRRGAGRVATDMEIVSPARPARRSASRSTANGAALPVDASPSQCRRRRRRPPSRRRLEATFATATLSAATPTIQLNVGGTIFETTARRSRATRRPFFGALARNRGAATSLFVDRDPTHFRHVLNYLRSGVLAAPADDDAKAELLLELEFYALHDFARGLCGPVLDLTKHLDAAGVLAERADEARLRDVFASGDAGVIGRLDRYEGLVDFYSTYPGGVRSPRRRPSTQAARCSTTRWSPGRPLGREGSKATCRVHRSVQGELRRFAQVPTRLSDVMRSGQSLHRRRVGSVGP